MQCYPLLETMIVHIINLYQTRKNRPYRIDKLGKNKDDMFSSLLFIFDKYSYISKNVYLADI